MSAARPAETSPWLVLTVVFLVSVAAVMAQFAAPPLMPVLMDAFRVDIHQAGSLMSIFSITGVILAFPAGLVLQRFGPMATGAAAMIAVVIGCSIAAAAADFGVLLGGRAVQGVGVGLVGVAAPAVVAAVFPPERRGMPMGIWAMWVPVGGILMYLLAPALSETFGWQSVFVLAAIVASGALVAYVAVLRSAGLGTGGGSTSRAMAELRLALRGRDIWLLALVFGLFATASTAPNTFTTTFLVDERAYSLSAASLVGALVLAGAGIGSIGAGWVSDRVGSRRRVLVVCLVIYGLLLAVPFAVGGASLPVAFFVVGVALGSIPAITFASVPELMSGDHSTGAGMAAVMFGQTAGMVIGPLLLASLIPSLGWVVSVACLAILVLVGAILGLALRLR